MKQKLFFLFSFLLCAPTIWAQSETRSAEAEVQHQLLVSEFANQHYEKAIAAGEKESGVTIHRVNAQYDSGEIVRQTTVPVKEGDTPDTLAARVLEREHAFLVEVISDIADGKITLG